MHTILHRRKRQVPYNSDCYINNYDKEVPLHDLDVSLPELHPDFIRKSERNQPKRFPKQNQKRWKVINKETISTSISIPTESRRKNTGDRREMGGGPDKQKGIAGDFRNEPNVVCFGFIWFVLPNVSPCFPTCFPIGVLLTKMILKMIKTAIIYNHRGRFGKDGAGPIEVRVTHRRAYYINTGVCVRPREWKFGHCES